MASIHFVCPICAQNLKVSATLAGRKGRCPFCSAKVRIPVDDNGSAEVLDPGKKLENSGVGPVPVDGAEGSAGTDGATAAPLDTAVAPAATGAAETAGTAGSAGGAAAQEPSVLVRPDLAPSSMAPVNDLDAPAVPQSAAEGSAAAGSLQAQLDRELSNEAPVHGHDSEAATVRWKAGHGPVIEPETAAPGAEAAAPLQITRLEPNADPVVAGSGTAVAKSAVVVPPAGDSAVARDRAGTVAPAPAADVVPDLPVVPAGAAAVPAKVETLKYDAANNPARMSGEQHAAGAVAPSSVADRFLETRERDGLKSEAGIRSAAGPQVAARTVPPPISLAGTPPGADQPHTPENAGNLAEMLAAGSEDKVTDVLASLPRERQKPTSAVAALATRGQTPNPPQLPVAPVASMQTPAMPVYAHGASSAGSLIGDRCDPSRLGQSAVPVIVWVAVVLVTLGSLTTWLVIDGLARRTAAIQASQAFLRLTDLAAAETEYFNVPRTAVAGPSALANAPATRVNEQTGSEYAGSLHTLQEKNLLTPALWNEGIDLLDAEDGRDAPVDSAVPPIAARRLAEGNGYRYVLWYRRAVTGQSDRLLYSQSRSRLDRGFAVAAIPTNGTNWAYAIDERGRLIEWRYTPPAAGGAPAAAQPGSPSDPVTAYAYPADSDFDKIPIR